MPRGSVSASASSVPAWLGVLVLPPFSGGLPRVDGCVHGSARDTRHASLGSTDARHLLRQQRATTLATSVGPVPSFWGGGGGLSCSGLGSSSSSASSPPGVLTFFRLGLSMDCLPWPYTFFIGFGSFVFFLSDGGVSGHRTIQTTTTNKIKQNNFLLSFFLAMALSLSSPFLSFFRPCCLSCVFAAPCLLFCFCF